METRHTDQPIQYLAAVSPPGIKVEQNVLQIDKELSDFGSHAINLGDGIVVQAVESGLNLAQGPAIGDQAVDVDSPLSSSAMAAS